MTRRVKRIIISVAAIVAVATLGAGYLTRANQTEFSPERLRFRSRTVYFGVISTQEREYSSAFADFLRQFDKMPNTTDSTWDFCAGSKIGIRGWRGRAMLMVRLSNGLRFPDYLEWTQDHPQIAPTVWKEFLRLIRLKRYDLAEYLIHAPWGGKSDEEILKVIEELSDPKLEIWH